MSFSRLWDSFLASWYYYLLPAILFFFTMFKKCETEDADGKKRIIRPYRELAKVFSLIMCATAIEQVASHQTEIMDLLVLALWFGWTIWKSCFQKTYNEGYRDGYNEAVGECENHGIKFPHIK